MPTPDREALDARLRAVERALTDPDESPDPPEGAGEPSPSADGQNPSADDEGTDEPPEGSGEQTADAPSRRALERRLLDLEAAVQALRGSLAAVDTEASRCPECGAERAPDSGGGQAVGMASPSMTTLGHDEPLPAVPERWPDDLAADGGHDGRES